MRALLTPLLAVLLLCGCGSQSFKPSEYPIRQDLIQPFEVRGKVAVGNAQTTNEKITVYSYNDATYTANVSAVTEVMVRQAQKEIDRHGTQLGGEGLKTIALRVDSLESESHVVFYKSKMLFQVTLGDGQVINLSAAHASARLQDDLDGCIADGVAALLQDQRVHDYLASELAPPPPPAEEMSAPAPGEAAPPADAPSPAPSPSDAPSSGVPPPADAPAPAADAQPEAPR